MFVLKCCTIDVGVIINVFIKIRDVTDIVQESDKTKGNLKNSARFKSLKSTP